MPRGYWISDSRVIAPAPEKQPFLNKPHQSNKSDNKTTTIQSATKS